MGPGENFTKDGRMPKLGKATISLSSSHGSGRKNIAENLSTDLSWTIHLKKISCLKYSILKLLS